MILASSPAALQAHVLAEALSVPRQHLQCNSLHSLLTRQRMPTLLTHSLQAAARSVHQVFWLP